MDAQNAQNGQKKVSGACLCGAVSFSLTLPTRFCAHCHCSMCRRNHGAGYVTWVVVPRSRFEVRAGADRLVEFKSSEHGRRTFCGVCGSSLFCESSHHPDQIDVVLAGLDGPIDREPQAHIYFDDRADWVFCEDGLPRLGGETGLEPLK